MHIEPDVTYILFRAVDDSPDIQTHIVIDSRIAQSIDNLIVELEGVRLNHTNGLILSQYNAVLDTGIAAAFEDCALQLAIEEYEDENGECLGVDGFSGQLLKRAVLHDHDILLVSGADLQALFGSSPDFLEDQNGFEGRVEVIIMPDSDADFWVRPILELQLDGIYLSLSSTGGRIPWSHIRRRLLDPASFSARVG